MNTKFPSGSKLVYADGTNVLFVVSSSGTVVTDTFLVFLAGTTNSAENSSTTDVRTTTKSGTAFSGSGSGNGTEGIIMKYDDSALTTADGTVTSFRFVGISAYTHSGSTTSANETTYKISEAGTFTITGVGYGIIRGKASTMSGTMKASPAGIYTITE
jgi:LysM repeat protein